MESRFFWQSSVIELHFLSNFCITFKKENIIRFFPRNKSETMGVENIILQRNGMRGSNFKHLQSILIIFHGVKENASLF